MNKPIIEKFFGKMICQKQLMIEGISIPILFNIYDGIAQGVYDGHEYTMEFPRLEAIKACEDLSQAVLEYCNNSDMPSKPQTLEDITALHVLVTFNTLYQDGKEWFNK